MPTLNPENSGSEQEVYPFVMGYLPEKFQRKAERELKDTPENRERALPLLREMLKADKHLEGLVVDDDDFLLQNLRSKKYDVSRAFSTIKAAFDLRKKHPNAFRNFEFENTAVAMRSKCVSVLPWRCQDGCAILHVQLDNWEPEEFPVEEMKRMVVIYLYQALKDPMTQVNGFKVIFDVKSNPVKHIKHLTPSNIYLLYHGTVDCCTGRFKAMHFVNKSITFKLGLQFLKPFLSSKIKQRIHLHSKPEELLDFFPRSALPVIYGGDLGDYDMTGWLNEVMRPEMLATLEGGNMCVHN